MPVDGIVLHGSGIQVSEAAMTGESDEMHKDSLEKCILKKKEKQEEMTKDEKLTAHSIPSPVLLSGT